MLCTLYGVRRILYDVHRMSRNTRYKQYIIYLHIKYIRIIYCPVYIVQWALGIVKCIRYMYVCILYIVQYTLYGVHCIIATVYCERQARIMYFVC